MTNHNKRTGVGRCFIISFCSSILVLIAISMIMAAIAMANEDPTGKIGLFSLISLLLSAMISGLLTARLNIDKKLGFSLTVALGVALLMLLAGVIVSAGRMSGGAFMNLGCYFGLFALSAYLGGRKSGHRRHKH